MPAQFCLGRWEFGRIGQAVVTLKPKLSQPCPHSTTTELTPYLFVGRPYGHGRGIEERGTGGTAWHEFDFGFVDLNKALFAPRPRSLALAVGRDGLHV